MPDGPHRFRPFQDVPWPGETADAAELIQYWHDLLKAPPFPDARAETYSAEADRIEEGRPPEHLPPSFVDDVRRASERHDLPIDWFTSSLRVAWRLQDALRFEDAAALKSFIAAWVVPHARLIARLAGAAHTWQLPRVAELATAFFLIDKLVHLPDELARDRLFIPRSDLVQAGVTEEMLRVGKVTPAICKVLWKQTIRIRDAFAQGQPLVRDLERRYRRPFKRNWLTGLEFVNEVERRDYDVWSRPVELSGVQRFQIRVLSWIGKGANRVR